MDRNTEIELNDLFDAIKSAIQAQFPEFETVLDHPVDRENLPVPACFFELTELIPVPEEDPGTDQVACMASFEAELLLSYRVVDGVNPKRSIRILASNFVAWLRLQRWGLPVGPSYPTGAYRDDFQPELDRYEVWRVEWSQTIHVGKSIWVDRSETPVPSEVRIIQSPRVGPDFVDEYEFLNGPLIDD